MATHSGDDEPSTDKPSAIPDLDDPALDAADITMSIGRRVAWTSPSSDAVRRDIVGSLDAAPVAHMPSELITPKIRVEPITNPDASAVSSRRDSGTAIPRNLAVVSPAPTGQSSYVMARRIGVGANGEVFEALQRSLGRTVAVKKLREDHYRKLANDPLELAAMEQEFEHEALVTGTLEHPNIVPVHDFGVDEKNRPILVMKMAKGRTWNAAIAADKDLPPLEFLSRHLPVLLAVAQAVAFAHSRGIVHRDLKPAQVVVGEFGETLLMDWGLAVYHGRASQHFGLAQHALAQVLPTPENAHNPAGTPAYMAPEQTESSARSIGPWTDIYLLGAILYELLTLTTPHRGTTGRMAMSAAATGLVEPPSKRAPGRMIPEDLERLCMACLAADREERPESVDDIVRGIRDHFSGSSRRRESAGLTKRASELFQEQAQHYLSHQQALVLLGQAKSLWPENPDLPMLESSLHESLAEMALEAGDKQLARLHAGMISDPARATRLDSRLAAASQEEWRRARSRWHMQIAAVALFLVTIALMFYVKATESNDLLVTHVEASAIELVGAFNVDSEAAAMSTRMFAATGKDRWRKRAEHYRNQLENRINRAQSPEAPTPTPGEAARLTTVRTSLDRFRNVAGQIEAVAAAGRLVEAEQALDDEEFANALRLLNASISSLRDYYRDKAEVPHALPLPAWLVGGGVMFIVALLYLAQSQTRIGARLMSTALFRSPRGNPK